VPLADVMARMAAGDAALVLLDARSEEERAVSTLPGSISRAQMEAAGPDAYANKSVVAFCTVGYLSAACACEMRRKGFNTVQNMGDGALLGYGLAGGKLVTPDGAPTRRVHTFMAGLGGLAADGLEPVFFEDAEARLAAANARIAETLGL